MCVVKPKVTAEGPEMTCPLEKCDLKQAGEKIKLHSSLRESTLAM